MDSFEIVGQQEQFAIDAVLIDFNMPRMNGPLTIIELRKIGFRGPIIGVSGGDDVTTREFMKAGADDVIRKPAKAEVLVGMLLIGLQRVAQDDSSVLVADNALRNGGNHDETPRREMERARREHKTCLKKFLDGRNNAKTKVHCC